MRNILILWFTFTSLVSNAQSGINPHIEVNVQWQYTNWEPTIVMARATSYHKKIKLHLLETIKYLQSRSTDNLCRSQLQNRYYAINELERYANQEVFPINEHAPYKTPVFIDNYGTHCAVGYLMKQSGAAALAQTIKENENLAYVFDIKTEGVAEWAASNGFTLNELALIQPSYFEPINDLNKISLETPRPVLKMASYRSFTYLLMQDSTYGNEVNPKHANYLLVHSSRFGLQDAGYPKTYLKPVHIAVFNNKLYVATATELYSADLHYHTGYPQNWKRENTYGVIYKLEATEYSLTMITTDHCYRLTAYDSSFEKINLDFRAALVKDVSLGNLIYTIGVPLGARSEIMIYDGDGWLPMYDDLNISFAIDGLASYNDTYLTYSRLQNENGLAIGIWDQNEHHRLSQNSIFEVDSLTSDWRINDIISTGNRLFVIGRFNKSKSVTNLEGKAIIELTQQGTSEYYPLPVTTMFEEVYAATVAGYELILSTDLGLYRLKHRLASAPQLSTKSIAVYPNPIQSNSRLMIDCPNLLSVNLFDNLGRIVVESTSNLVTIPANATTGLYHCLVETKDGKHYFEKVVVE